MKSIIHVLDINAPASNIYKAINTESGLAGWWTTQVFYEDSSEGPIHFAFMGDFNPVMKLSQSQFPAFIEWTCINGVPAWQNDTFTFELLPNKDSTTVKFSHNFSNDLSDEQKGRFNYIWGYYLQSLRLYCEEGKGNPFSLT